MSDFSRRQALGGLLVVSPATAFGYQANSKVSFGIIGTGGRGVYVGTHMTNDANAKLGAICDIYPDKIDQGKSKIPGGDQVKAYRDMNELLARPDIDAVLIATPVYLHPDHFALAVQAKKHIYCEKPGGASVKGVKKLLAAGKAADPSKTIQFGFQQRYSPEYLKAWSIYKEGKIGDVKQLTSYWILGNEPPKAAPVNNFPKEEEKIRRWGSWRETSGGPIVEQDCHGIDTLNWWAGAHPTRAIGTGGLRYPIPYGDWTSDHHNITYYYPGGIEGWLISVKHTAGYRDVKEQVYGSKGMLELSRTYYKWHCMIPSAPLKNADDLRDRSLTERGDSKREITIDAIEVFFKSIIDKKPHNMTQDAADSTFTALLGRMAFEQKREVTWDEMLRSE
jgi:predicted dehydrogenase